VSSSSLDSNFNPLDTIESNPALVPYLAMVIFLSLRFAPVLSINGNKNQSKVGEKKLMNNTHIEYKIKA
jgi:hypothetical protein